MPTWGTASFGESVNKPCYLQEQPVGSQRIQVHLQYQNRRNTVNIVGFFTIYVFVSVDLYGDVIHR